MPTECEIMSLKERERFSKLQNIIYDSRYPMNPAPTQQELKEYRELLEKYEKYSSQEQREMRNGKSFEDRIKGDVRNINHYLYLGMLPSESADERFCRRTGCGRVFV